jgi:D-glycero-D-manno-heptose 1,7-bisphosphate phosphatase
LDKTSPLILLDRDGTLITEQDYLKDPRKVKFLPGAIAGLKQLARAGLPLVVISNQSGVGRGLMTRDEVGQVHRRFVSLLRAQGVRLAGIYWCPHHPKLNCACRKPKLKLVRQAARDLKRSWKHSISVGDKWSDVQLGQRTGGLGVLVLTGYGRGSLMQHAASAADHVAPNFKAAAGWILKAAQKESPRWTKKRRKG